MTGRRRLISSRDDRAIAFNIALFFGTILMGFFLAIVFQPVADQTLAIAANETSRQSAKQGQDYLRFAWGNLHVLVIGFVMLQLIVAAAFEADVGGLR